MNILVTGASGFIGKYFIKHYKDIYNIKTFSFLKDDFDSLSLQSIDIIFHLSALVHQMDEASADEYERVNITQTMKLGQKAKNKGVRQFIFMSSIAVCGIQSGVIHEDSTCNPITEYAKSKFKAENELLKLQDDEFCVSILRPPIVNGYDAPGNMKSLVSLVKKVPILPFGRIQNRRSMVYVGNLCHLVDKIIEKKASGIFLISDDKPLSTSRLIQLIANELDKKVYLVKIPFFENILKFVKPNF
ncbi:MAG: NAD-dependent epimerase/dehydratase family protein, partial [Sulfurimonas sp.]|nr:NAD-dependent epimerase/dehydratase family protein [Sulfurimonas sp.]